MPKGFQKGHKKTGGKVKGSINKERLNLIDRIREKFPGLCPIEILCDTILSTPDEATRVACCKEVAQYLYPKLKSIDHNLGTQDGKPLNLNMQVEFIPVPKVERK